jgi:hypothetical protein
MELSTVMAPQVVNKEDVKTNSNSKFIEANTIEVSLSHLKNECIIPVFAKDNETTISHFEFIEAVNQAAKSVLVDAELATPSIRVSHMIKGRIPSAIGKPAKELMEHEKTIYYDRMAFMIEIPSITHTVNNQKLTLAIGGVRAYNQENLYTKKTIEKFKVFVGFKNMVCTNLCVATDGFQDEIRVSSLAQLQDAVTNLILNYNSEAHLGNMEKMSKYQFTETEFAHFIGKMKMYPYLSKEAKNKLFPLLLTESQINSIVKDYFMDNNFKRNSDDKIDLWKVYNLFTGAIKSSYIGSHLERNVNAYEFINMVANTLESNVPTWYTHPYSIAN